MKGSKIWKIIWMTGIYIILSLILYLVIIYKVEWEHKDLNTYLYFYDCNNSLCTSTTNQRGYYNKVLCTDGTCPYIMDIIDNMVILNNNGNKYIYNYIDDKIVNENYENYIHINNHEFIVSNKENKQGIIDLNGNVLVEFKYDYIEDYKNGFVVYKNNNLYGIDTTTDGNKVDAKFEHIVLIGDSMYAGKLDNKYKIYSYESDEPKKPDEFNYIYSFGDVMLVAYNNKIDILTIDFNSTLLIKFDTFFKYQTEKEQKSLNIHSDGNYIFFKVYISEYEYTEHIYDFLSKKLVK